MQDCTAYTDLFVFALTPTHHQVEAEKAAWQLAKELGLDVVTILPNFVLVSTLPLAWPADGIQRLQVDVSSRTTELPAPQQAVPCEPSCSVSPAAQFVFGIDGILSIRRDMVSL